MRLHTFGNGYAWIEGSPGSLIQRDESGDVAVPPHPGRWTLLEEACTLEEAQEIARAWSEAGNVTPCAATPGGDPPFPGGGTGDTP